LQPLPFDSTVFPKKGIKLSYLEEFFRECGGRDSLNDLTTTEVCERYIKPITETTQSSYCELMSVLGHEGVGEATVFISHAWKYKFLDVIDSILQHFGLDLMKTTLLLILRHYNLV